MSGKIVSLTISEKKVVRKKPVKEVSLKDMDHTVS
jgi:hypothetical protein